MESNSQNAIPNSSGNNNMPLDFGDGGDWQEEVHQKIKALKEMYLPELNEMYWKITSKLQMTDSLPQPPNPEQIEKLRMFRSMLERIIAFLQLSKNHILPSFKDKMPSYERQIINFINSNKARTSVPPLQQINQQAEEEHLVALQNNLSRMQPFSS